MATPQSMATDDTAADSARKLEQITFRFCSECSNMLYPKEDEELRKLQFTCRTCQYTEDAQSTCVFRNVLNSSSGETAGVTQDVASDPTVSDEDSAPTSCLHCGCLVYCATCGDPVVVRIPEDGFDDPMWTLHLYQASRSASSSSDDMFEDDVEVSDEEDETPRTSVGSQGLYKEEPDGSTHA